MGKLALIVRITPKEEIDAEAVISKIKDENFGEARLKDIRKEPLAFGIFIVKAAFLLPEKKEELTEEVVNKLKALDAVEDAEIEGMTLV
ncbi:MAG: hypothetical protein DRO04_01260 [Candidatus Iainarchaeum archaeon]|uniref:Elongation factor 1-beta n=1 Tax=Candidatus Iainarchaeum sp. TaxID=3101447 RepID=A0A497JHI5_9ARCH|nr:MAG: hypothetical protein DRO04_01260 [Candidatus Diapherotrites archaeon]